MSINFKAEIVTANKKQQVQKEVATAKIHTYRQARVQRKLDKIQYYKELGVSKDEYVSNQKTRKVAGSIGVWAVLTGIGQLCVPEKHRSFKSLGIIAGMAGIAGIISTIAMFNGINHEGRYLDKLYQEDLNKKD